MLRALLLLACTAPANLVSAPPTSDYGPYTAGLITLEKCKQKSSNITELQTDIFVIDGVQYSSFQFKVDRSVGPILTKMVIARFQNGAYYPILRYVIHNPCEHFFLGPILKITMNVTSSCFFQKGFYAVKIAVNSVFHQLFGDSFFYGTFHIKAVLYTKKMTFSCIEVDFVVNKATSTRRAKS